MKRTIIFMRGLPGSGKSTWAKRWAQEDPLHRVRIAKDDIRRMLGPYWMPEREDLVGLIWLNSILEAIGQGYSVVVDDMNFDQTAAYKLIIDTVRSYDVQVVFEDFLTKPDVCELVDSYRSGDAKIGPAVINERYAEHTEFWQRDNYDEHCHALIYRNSHIECLSGQELADWRCND